MTPTKVRKRNIQLLGVSLTSHLHGPSLILHLAERLQAEFPKTGGYSLMIPMSRQEPGIDLAILKRTKSRSTATTFQIKASRTWITNHTGTVRPRTGRRVFQYTMRFNTFELPEQADFFLLSGMFAPDTLRTRRVDARWYRSPNIRQHVHRRKTKRQMARHQRCHALYFESSFCTFRRCCIASRSSRTQSEQQGTVFSFLQ